jgi:hypothetical protein
MAPKPLQISNILKEKTYKIKHGTLLFLCSIKTKTKWNILSGSIFVAFTYY